MLKKVKKRQLLLFLIGFVLFGIFFYKLGGDSLTLIESNFNLKYLLIYVGITTFAICPLVWRWQVILKGYHKKVSFWTLLRIQLAGYAVSYVTPSARVGGEPLRIYMLEKECNVDYKTGTVSVILDRYMELLGTLCLGIVGLMLVLFLPAVSYKLKVGATLLILASLIVLYIFYYRLEKNKGFFSPLFSLFMSRKMIEKYQQVLKDVDEKMSYFIIHHKKEFFLSFFFYAVSGSLFLIEFKYLLLSFGVPTTMFEVILIVVVLGAANFVPLPMALGSLEAGQSSLFILLKDNSTIGFALSLVHRIRGITISLVGFVLIMIFSGKRVLKQAEEREKEKS